MKRFVLLLMCITLALFVLAAPAAAKGRVTQRIFRPPADATIMWGPWWLEYSGDTGTFADVTTYQADPNDPEIADWYKTVPIEDDLYIFSVWGGVNYGYVGNVPKYLPHTVTVTDPAGVTTEYGPTVTAKYWYGPYLYDQFWIDFWLFWMGWQEQPFNSAIAGGRFYLNSLYFPVELTRAGLYTVHVSWEATRPLNELNYQGVDPARPTHSAAGEQAYEYTFSMYVE